MGDTYDLSISKIISTALNTYIPYRTDYNTSDLIILVFIVTTLIVIGVTGSVPDGRVS